MGRITIFEKEWALFSVNPISIRLFELCFPGEGNKADDSPPKVETCQAWQVAGTSPNLPTMGITFAASDDQSSISERYFTVSSNGQVLAEEEIEESGVEVQFSPDIFPEGPLTITAVALNGDQLKSSSTCVLPAWDTSVPTGLAKGRYPFQSHTTVLSLEYIVDETTPLIALSWGVGSARGQEDLRAYKKLPVNARQGSMKSSGYSFVHGSFVFLSVLAENKLGFEAVLPSQGILVDLTHPAPPYQEIVLDERLSHVGCDLTLFKHTDDAKPVRDLFARCESPDPLVMNHLLHISNGSLYNGASFDQMKHWTRATQSLTANW